MGVEGRVGLVATEGIVGEEDLVVTVEVEDQVGMVDILVAMEGIIADVEDIGGIMVGMVGSYPDYLSAVS